MNKTVLKNVVTLGAAEISLLRRLKNAPLSLRVEFARNALPVRVLSVLAMHPTIVFLELYATRETFAENSGEVELQDIREGFPQLRDFRAENFAIDAEAMFALAEAAKRSQFASLTLKDVYFGGDFSPLARLLHDAAPSFVLDVQGCETRGLDQASVPATYSLAESVRLKSAGFHDADAPYLFPFLSSFKMLRVLDLSGNRFGGRSLQWIVECVRGVPSLRVLNLSGNKFDSNDKIRLGNVAKSAVISILI